MSVKSSKSTFLVLKYIAAASNPVGAGELSKNLGLPMSTSLRILTTLEASGFIERFESSSRFVIGKDARTLAFAFLSQFPLRDIALPYLQQLTLESGHTSSLFLQIGWFSVRAASVHGENELTHRSPIGEHRRLFAGAPSLAIYGSLSPEERLRADAVLAPVDELERARGDEAVAGIAHDGALALRSGVESSAWDFAMPVRDAGGRLAGVVALEAITESAKVRMQAQDSAVREIVAHLNDKAAQMDGESLSHYRHVPAEEIDL